MKIVGDTTDAAVHTIKPQGQRRQGSTYKQTMQTKRADLHKIQHECWSCGQTHDVTNKEMCPAYGKECKKCHKKQHHFASRCWSKIPGSQRIRLVDNEEDDEALPMEVTAVQLDDSQLVTLKLESGNYIQFQADTGAQWNVIPFTIYKKATRDFSLAHISWSQTAITAYGGQSISMADTVRLKVWHGDYQYKLDCKLVDSERVRPLLGRKACVGMKIITYLDNDSMNSPDTKYVTVFAPEVITPRRNICSSNTQKFLKKG